MVIVTPGTAHADVGVTNGWGEGASWGGTAASLSTILPPGAAGDITQVLGESGGPLEERSGWGAGICRYGRSMSCFINWTRENEKEEKDDWLGS
ncbi:hypothetical protein HPP92_007065 [Vanilla planifolia]|uniref:Uncharacterized protein n=1 Tax=Vanilla planifolia TaxID=51239 RepID=A0A835RQN1_VANPL|nr:hypothetical protein HPP92_007065 [Vanilla planifolia]